MKRKHLETKSTKNTTKQSNTTTRASIQEDKKMPRSTNNLNTNIYAITQQIKRISF